MSDDLTLEQIDRIIVNHESGVQLTGVGVYRQLRACMEEIAALKAENASLKARETRRKQLRKLVISKPETQQ